MLAIILGTRPEIIKMSPIIRECVLRGLDYFVIHTGQHYSYNMDKIFFKELELPEPKYGLDIGSGSHGQQTGRIMAGVEEVLLKERPEIVLVEGDTNTVLGGALAASKIHIKVGHVEAGLRSYNRLMPEEINRIVTDHISDYLFTPTKNSKDNLLKEGIEVKKIYITGNTIVDAVYQNIKISNNKHDIITKLNLTPNDYFVVTVHRAENVDNKKCLKEIIDGLKRLHEELSIPIIFPVHPRTKKRIEEFDLSTKGIQITDPLGYLEFLQLESNSKLLLTDSGGIQEESCILKVPCITMRDDTERPETITAGSNKLVGCTSEGVVNGAYSMINISRTWQNPYGKGDAGKRIVDICISEGNI